MKYLVMSIIVLNLSYQSFCAQKDSHNPGILLLQSTGRSEQPKEPLEMSRLFELKFKNEFEPQFKVAAKQLWKEREAKKRKIWIELVMTGKGPAGRYLDQIIEDKFKTQFVELYKEKYIQIFGQTTIPQHFQDLDQQDPKERLELIAANQAHLFYEKKKNSWRNWFCGCCS